ncbi:DUF2061 domain-containing protein [Candidatus Pacearchaeota archaeon]|nr:DUF2061 domain-containing protein [Candidatus Pacearchaeota archaeon]
MRRTVVKTALWRCCSFTVTATAMTIYSNDIKVGITLASILQSIKLVGQIYYERAWNKVGWGRTLSDTSELQGSQTNEERLSSLSETVRLPTDQE